MGLDFQVMAAEVDERENGREAPASFVRRLALAKADAVAQSQGDSWVIGADTVVAADDTLLGKPTDTSEALEMLERLNGRWHEVWTAFALNNREKNIEECRAVRTRVKFWEHPVEVLKAYVATGGSLDKAGAYGIQGLAAGLVERIEGSYSNVVGLPLAELLALLMEFKVIAPNS